MTDTDNRKEDKEDKKPSGHSSFGIEDNDPLNMGQSDDSMTNLQRRYLHRNEDVCDSIFG